VEVAVRDRGTQNSGQAGGDDFESVLSHSPGDQGATAFDNCLVVRTLVDNLLSRLGVHVLPENEWEEGLIAVLHEMTDEGLLALYDCRLQIEIRDHDCAIVWAYFPVHRHEWLARFVDLKPATQVLLVISASRVEDRPTSLFKKKLRHQIGHVLRYLQNPTRPNECYNATRKWKNAANQKLFKIHNLGEN
jgi:hypothetical protein